MTQLTFVSPKAIISEGVTLGRFCIVEDDVEIGENVVVEDYVMIGARTKIGAKSKLGTYTKIGKGVLIGHDCAFSSYCEIRDNCRIGNRVLMGSRGTLSANTIVDDDVIMKYAFVVTDTPDLQRNHEKHVGRLKKKARFGAQVVIMPGVTIGENAEIGACSQVRVDVPDNEIWFGNPARYYRDVE